MKKNIKTRSNIIGKRRHGFLRRMSSINGRGILRRRRQKGRRRLAR